MLTLTAGKRTCNHFYEGKQGVMFSSLMECIHCGREIEITRMGF